MQSVAVLISILVLCCMASARRGMHKLAVRHLEARQNCNFPTDYPPRCIQAFTDFSNSDDITPALLDGICEEACVGPLNDYFECLLRDKGYADYFCVKQNDDYCLVIGSNVADTCDTCDDGKCPDDCRSCLSRYVGDLSCCFDQYRSYSFVNATDLEKDDCGNTYNTCSGGAIAVPTVLTALLLMVMAAIVM